MTFRLVAQAEASTSVPNLVLWRSGEKLEMVYLDRENSDLSKLARYRVSDGMVEY